MHFRNTILVATLVSSLAFAEQLTPLQRFQRACRPEGLHHLGFEPTWPRDERQRTIEELRDWVRTQNVRSPRDLLASFQREGNDRWPTRTFAMSQSRSAQRQGITASAPRVLAFGNGMLMGMTNHSNQGVEVIQYDAERNRFRFGFIDFSRNPATVTEPGDCLRCHGNPPRPIWQTITFWDLLTRVPRRDRINQPGSIYALMAQPEPDRWQDALQFTAYLDGLVLRRAAQTLIRSRDFNRYRYAALGAVLGCSDIPSFLPLEVRRSHNGQDRDRMAVLSEEIATRVSSTYEGIFAFGDRFRPRNDQRERIENGSILHDGTQAHDADRIAGIRYLFEGRGVNVANLSSNFNPGERSYGYGFGGSSHIAQAGGTSELACHLLPVAVEADRALAPLIESRVDGNRDATQEECDLLRRLSLAALGAPPPQPQPQAQPGSTTDSGRSH